MLNSVQWLQSRYLPQHLNFFIDYGFCLVFALAACFSLFGFCLIDSKWANNWNATPIIMYLFYIKSYIFNLLLFDFVSKCVFSLCFWKQETSSKTNNQIVLDWIFGAKEALDFYFNGFFFKKYYGLQVEQAQAGLESLALSQKTIHQLHENFISIEKYVCWYYIEMLSSFFLLIFFWNPFNNWITLSIRLCQECQNLIENHDQIKLLSNARNNLNTTLKVSFPSFY